MATDFQAIYDVCKVSDRIFVLHPNFRRANFYSQQLRALALIEALFAHDLLRPGNRTYAVVGRGIAGLTASAALATLGASVISIDRKADMDLYHNVVHRELHPNIIFWPFQDLRPITNLPFLNWSCNTAALVRNQILDQWRETFADVVERKEEEVVELTERASGVSLRCRSGPVIEADGVVVAAGFLKERPAEAPNFKRYWSAYDFDLGTEITVAGSGDGGLIDTAAQFFGPRTVAAARALAYSLEHSPIKTDVMSKEQDAIDAADGGDLTHAHQVLNDFYGKVVFPPSSTRMLQDIAQMGRKVKLYYKDPSPYAPFAAPINKLMLAFCNRTFRDDIEVKQGDLDIRDSQAPKLTVGAATTALDRDTLLIRIGADAAVNSFLQDPQKETLAKNARDHKSVLTAVVSGEFNHDLYVRNPPRRIAPSPMDSRFNAVQITRLLQALLGYVDGGLLGAQVTRKRSTDSSGTPRIGILGVPEIEYVVTPIQELEEYARALFPTSILNVKIMLAESHSVEFAHSLGV